MLWHIGVDEAGYGPNLGPFVMTLVACRAPDDSDLWQRLEASARRASDKPDGRLVVADSKQVYSPSRGLADLERTVLAIAPWIDPSDRQAQLHELLTHLALDINGLKQESWFVGDTAVPTQADSIDIIAAKEQWRRACEGTDVTWGCCRAAIVPAPRFNELVDRWDSKAAVLSVAVTDLMRTCLAATPPEPMCFVLDKHGGRNAYGALLQHAFADGIVLAECEGRARSVYRVEGLDRPVRIVIAPKADAEHFTVALASMISKYVRELLMREFNRYWQAHVPGLAPTAGYPTDAVRFIDAIRPAMMRLGIAERLVWRSR